MAPEQGLDYICKKQSTVSMAVSYTHLDVYKRQVYADYNQLLFVYYIKWLLFITIKWQSKFLFFLVIDLHTVFHTPYYAVTQTVFSSLLLLVIFSLITFCRPT